VIDHVIELRSSPEKSSDIFIEWLGLAIYSDFTDVPAPEGGSSPGSTSAG
jgi:hypothetical protein